MKSGVAIGVAGCGYWGPNLIRNFSNLPGAKLAAICDPREDRLLHMRGLYPGVESYSDFGVMLTSVDLDVVVVATPVRTHYELAKKALLAGKHVLIEKPMAASVAECNSLVEIAEKKGLTLMVGHTYLYAEPIRFIAELVRKGDIGRPLSVNSQRLNLGLFQKDINVVWDLAPHDISIILHLLGEMPLYANCQGNAHITPGIEDVTNTSLTFGEGRFATIQNSWLEPRKVRQMTIVGTSGMIVYDDLEPREKIRIYDTRVERPPHYDTYDQFHYSYHYGDCKIPHLQQEEPLTAMCRHFLECIADGSKPRSCGRQGQQLVSILEACSASLLANGGPVLIEGGSGSVEGMETDPVQDPDSALSQVSAA